MTDTPPPTNPIEDVDPASLVALFDSDPATLPRVDLDKLIGELRRRANVAASEAAAAEAAPKSRAKKPKAGSSPVESIADAITADKPVEEVSIDDLDFD